MTCDSRLVRRSSTVALDIVYKEKDSLVSARLVKVASD
jgi:hypothetical protein